MPWTEEQKREFYDAADVACSSGSFSDYCAATHTTWESLSRFQRDFLCPLFEEFAKGTGVRLLVHAPPGTGKSSCVSERGPAYILGTDPMASVFEACHNVDFASSFGQAVRDVMGTREHRKFFPDPDGHPLPNSPRERFFTAERERAHTSQPSFQAIGIISGFTGRHPSHLIVDDPYRGSKEAESDAYNEHMWHWWTRQAQPRIKPWTNVLLMYHRYGRDDFFGRVVQQGGFRVVRFPLLGDANEDGCDPTGRAEGEPLVPELLDLQWCLDWKARDPYVFAGQAQGSPVAEGDLLVDPAWLRECEWDEAPHNLRFYHRGYDMALTSKKRSDQTASAIGGFHEGLLYIFGMQRVRRDIAQGYQMILGNAASDPRGTFVALFDEVTHLTYIQQLRYQDGVLFDEVKGQGRNKLGKAAGWIKHARMGKVVLVRPKPGVGAITGDADWIPWFKDQCLHFRNADGDADDAIDALSAMYASAYKRTDNATKEEDAPIPGTLAYFGYGPPKPKPFWERAAGRAGHCPARQR